MSKIRVLSEQLANKIAAGEVVERPASVVKELIENSLDSGASRIEIEIEGGGTGLIRVLDNGEGMVEDDVLLCLERHGTSKIQEDRDLDGITSLGFRGEAIPSISSVSKMTITSRYRSADLGTTAVLQYGKLIKIHESGCPQGTVVEIRNLFANTPARKKFLRTRRTELSHIDEIVKNYALAAPQVSFLLSVDNRQTLRLDKEQDIEQRLASILHYTGDFISIGSKGQKSLPKLSGFLVPPDAQIQGSARINLLVNGRSVKDRMLSHGVAEGLRGFMMKGRYPAGLLQLQIDPSEVDVNVHPAKQEVRFRSSRDIHQLVVQSIQDAMQQYQQRLRSSFFMAKGDSNASIQQPAPQLTTVTKAPEPISYRQNSSEPLPVAKSVVKVRCNAPKEVPHSPVRQTVLHSLPNTHHGLQVIGQFENLYIFCQSSDGLVVIDQHAAHERLLFEKLKKQYLKGTISSQTLLFPETVELSLNDAEKVEQHADTISKMGFAIRDFGDNSYVISAVPALGATISPSKLFFDILEQFGSTRRKEEIGGSLLEDILASMACKAAVKAGDRLSSEEIEALLDDMAQADLFSHCPHGRPVIKQFSHLEIKKWFHRT